MGEPFYDHAIDKLESRGRRRGIDLDFGGLCWNSCKLPLQRSR
jgi:hypothetical protein